MGDSKWGLLFVYMLFCDYIGPNYKEVKLIVKRNCWKNGMRFDEDVFGEVIAKCLEVLKDSKSETEFIAYILVSYNHKYWNDIKNCYNSRRGEMVNEPAYIQHTSTDLNIIYKVSEDMFGKEDVELFKDWMGGYSVRELEERTGRKNLTYRFKKIKEFISKNKGMIN